MDSVSNGVVDANFDHVEQNSASYAIDSYEDLVMTDLQKLPTNEVVRYHFASVELAYQFYMNFAKCRGFGVRRSTNKRNKEHELLSKRFVCYFEGYRTPSKVVVRKRAAKPLTRCGCKAMMQVRLHVESCRWFVTYFSNEHNHQCFDSTFTGFLPAHRKMSEAQVEQILFLSRSGVGSSQAFGIQACQAPGYQYIGYDKKDVYNELARRRRHIVGDGGSALLYLKEMALSDPCMYYSEAVDSESGRLRHLFWSDGTSQLDYELFGDVLAFDATYKKNKYTCPLVVFSGVNNHNQTTVFAAALVSDETEQTYVWLLEQFLSVMKGKAPGSVITDGDLAMRKAISKVFPDAYHRLCAWHLMRNATSNIGDINFNSALKKCMYGDFEIGVFVQKWFAMVEEFNISDRPWITEMYNKKHMWAAAFMRGQFFAGFRTTSRCEGFHSLLKKYVKSHFDLHDFVHHFHRCVSYMRYKEKRAYFDSIRNTPEMETTMKELEMHASKIYTRQIFFHVRAEIHKASKLKLVETKENFEDMIYVVSKDGGKQKMSFVVALDASEMSFKCSCLRMESLGIPCSHIIVVLGELELSKFPKSLVLDRWSINAKAEFDERIGGDCMDSVAAYRYFCLDDLGKQVYTKACLKSQFFDELRDTLLLFLKRMKGSTVVDNGGVEAMNEVDGTSHKEPHCGMTKAAKGKASRRKRNRCSTCREVGHNKTSCPVRKHICSLKKAKRLGAFAIDEEDDNAKDDCNSYSGEANEEYDGHVDSDGDCDGDDSVHYYYEDSDDVAV